MNQSLFLDGGKMNNEPYGWVKNGEYVLYIDKPDSVFNYIPLYTHPVKELTETSYETVFDGEKYTTKLVEPAKELTDEVKDALMDALSGWRYIRECHGDLYGVGWDRVQEKLEAILRKAQE